MDGYKEILDRCLIELDEWVKNPPDGDRQGELVAPHMKEWLLRADETSAMDEFELAIATAMHFLTDQGPSDERFMPTFLQLVDALYRLAKKRKKKAERAVGKGPKQMGKVFRQRQPDQADLWGGA